jgi:hypothetical protein
MNKKPAVLYKTLVIGILILLIGMNVISSTGNLETEKLVNISEQKTKEFFPFEGVLPFFGLYKDSSKTIKQYELMLLSPVINFPLPGEVFRVGDIIDINGTTSMPDFKNYTLEWGIGQNPNEWFTTGITLINNGTIEIINDTVGFLDTGFVTEAEFYTIQLAVNLMSSEQYIVNVSIYLDPTLHINFPFGWPREIQGSQVAIWSPIALSDINNDGYQEIGFGTVTVVPAGDNNYDYVIDHMGNVLEEWPIQLYGIQGASLTFADIDGSTNNEEVIGGLWGDKIYVWDDNGTLVDGWPKNIYVSRASATVNDIDCDGDLEIILPTTDGGGLIYAFHHNGNMVNGWPVYIGSPVRRAVATADIDKDGFPEILFGDQDGYIHALNHDGSTVDGWPQQAHDFIKSSPIIADIEGDGDLEIIICSGFTQKRIISVWHHDGIMVDGWPQENGMPFVQPSVGDIDNDGDLEVLAGGAVPNTPYARFFIWHHDGSIVDGWPIKFPWDGSQNVDYIYAQPVTGDIDGDTDVEIIVGSYNNKLYAWHHNATNVTGWPKIIGDSVDSTAAIADIDNDKLVEVVVAGDDGKIYVWDVDGIYNSSHIEWPMFQHDTHHTGCYSRDTGSNQPPTAPTITGQINGKVGTSYQYQFTSYDIDGDDIAEYIVNWGDGPDQTVTGSFPSGSPVTASHTWTTQGTYTIKSKAKDIYGAEGPEGTLTVTIPRDKAINNPFLNWLQCYPNLVPLLQRFLQCL